MGTFHATKIAGALVDILQAAVPEYEVRREMPETQGTRPGKLAVIVPNVVQSSRGTHRTAQQTYTIRVAGVHRKRSTAEADDVECLAATLQDAIAADPYLQGTCWSAYVRRIYFGANGYLCLTVVARRSEVFPTRRDVDA